jgi:hypothetical protein
MFRHDARTTLYAPLRTVIWDSSGEAWSPSTSRARSSRASESGVADVGVELDRKLAALLEVLELDVPDALV